MQSAGADAVAGAGDRSGHPDRDHGGGADRSACVAGSGGQIHFLERCAQIDLAVGDGVHGAATGKGEVVARMFFVQCVEQGEKGLFVDDLRRVGEVPMFLFERCTRRARGSEQIGQFSGVKGANLGRTIVPTVGHVVGVMPEIRQVQAKGAIRLNADQLAHLLEIFWFAVRREAHHFVFVAVMGKADELGDGGIENP